MLGLALLVLRCWKCNQFLAEYGEGSTVRVKCHRCNAFTQVNVGRIENGERGLIQSV